MLLHILCFCTEGTPTNLDGLAWTMRKLVRGNRSSADITDFCASPQQKIPVKLSQQHIHWTVQTSDDCMCMTGYQDKWVGRICHTFKWGVFMRFYSWWTPILAWSDLVALHKELVVNETRYSRLLHPQQTHEGPAGITSKSLQFGCQVLFDVIIAKSSCIVVSGMLSNDALTYWCWPWLMMKLQNLQV